MRRFGPRPGQARGVRHLAEVDVEFIGTYTLIFVGAGATLSTGDSDLLLIALAHGLAIAVMVSAGRGHPPRRTG